MAKKLTLREQRRLAREAQQRRQRNIILAGTGVVIALIALLAFLAWNRQRLENIAATATTVAQMATNTIVAATQAVQSTAAAELQSTSSALASSVGPMTFGSVPTDTTTTASGLQYVDLEEGSGDPAQAGDTVNVHYTGWLTDGTQFDSSVGSQPYSVTIGQGSVIPGWDEGLAGMRVGGRRRLVIPPELGYGAEGSPPDIPGSAILVFEIVMVSIQ